MRIPTLLLVGTLCLAYNLTSTPLRAENYTLHNDTLLLKDPFGTHFEAVVHPGPNPNYRPQIEQGDTSTSKIKLPRFQGSTQGNAPWCWACCAAMVLYHQGIQKTACQIVSDVLKKNCCSLFASASCWSPGVVQNALHHYGVPTRTLIQNHLTLDEKTRHVVRELKKGKPTILILRQIGTPKPGTAGAHSIVAYGIEGLNQPNPKKVKLIIYDPAYGPRKIRPQELQKYNNGPYNPNYQWSQTVVLT